MNTSRASSKTPPKAAPDRETFGELGDDFFANARVRKADRVIREASSTMARRGRPPKGEGEKKEAVSIRLSPNVLAFFRGQGEGWQTRIDEMLSSLVDVMTASESELCRTRATGVDHLESGNLGRDVATARNVSVASASENALVGSLIVDVHRVAARAGLDTYCSIFTDSSALQSSSWEMLELMTKIAKRGRIEPDVRTGEFHPPSPRRRVRSEVGKAKG